MTSQLAEQWASLGIEVHLPSCKPHPNSSTISPVCTAELGIT